MKTCNRCYIEKEITEFVRSRDHKDGYRSACKMCMKDRKKRNWHDWYLRHLEANREKGKTKYAKWRANNYQDALESNRRQTQKRDPIKHKARLLFHSALKKGEIERPKKCTDCPFVDDGSAKTAKIHGHHDDYSKPLDVVWLCRNCHMKRHRKFSGLTNPNKD